ncbi:transcription initiation factor TFIID subunit 11-like [Haliotis asinina]|uniref:transcription initiation factor TFIID subunit 11-like n=1 Tax=Haliotis asinina TaxID=109174 RepID=UPI0035327500
MLFTLLFVIATYLEERHFLEQIRQAVQEAVQKQQVLEIVHCSLLPTWTTSRYFALLQDERYHVKDVLIIHEDLICVTYTVRKSESSKETKVKTPKAVPPKWVVIPPPGTTPATTMTRKTQKEEEVVVVVSKKKKKTPTKKTLVNPMDTPATAPPKQKKQKLEEKVPVKTSPKKVSKSISHKGPSAKSVSPKSTCLKSTLPKGTPPKGTLPKGTPPNGTPITKKTKKKEAPTTTTTTTTKAADPQSVKKQMTSDVLWNNDQQTVDVSPDKLTSPQVNQR